uniref:Uncharacterized protein n=1 Tax=Rhizophora mucronata TaxID=61149 RepID=A0A2P2N9V3_RHIMU
MTARAFPSRVMWKQSTNLYSHISQLHLYHSST